MEKLGGVGGWFELLESGWLGHAELMLLVALLLGVGGSHFDCVESDDLLISITLNLAVSLRHNVEVVLLCVMVLLSAFLSEFGARW